MNIAVAYSSVDLSTAADLVSNWRLELVRQAQAVAGLRAANVKTYDRRNTAHTLAFTVTRAPVASAKAALAFLATHQLALDAVTGVADIVVTLTPATANTITLKNATLTRAAGRIVGCTTIFDYELTAGLLVYA
jgi:hypothetical protein